MDELHDAAESIFRVVVPAAAESRREEMKKGTEALSARAEYIFADLPDERNIGTQAFMDPVFHPFHVGLEFFEDVLKSGYHTISLILKSVLDADKMEDKCG
jgi:hypothetical protein